MNLDGIDGTHLFGYMAALGTLVSLDERARSQRLLAPRLHFLRDGTAIISDFTPIEEVLIDAVFDELQASRPYYEEELSEVKRPVDFTPATLAQFASRANRREANIFAGLACCVGEEVFESTVCAANGASHQYLVQSMRDVLSLVQTEHLRAALFAPWQRDYEVPDSIRKQLNLGSRKPTLRLDPADERLYALRFSNPTTTSDFKTELGTQALAIPAFSVVAVVPRDRPLSVASSRRGNRIFSIGRCGKNLPLWRLFAHHWLRALLGLTKCVLAAHSQRFVRHACPATRESSRSHRLKDCGDLGDSDLRQGSRDW